MSLRCRAGWARIWPIYVGLPALLAKDLRRASDWRRRCQADGWPMMIPDQEAGSARMSAASALRSMLALMRASALMAALMRER